MAIPKETKTEKKNRSLKNIRRQIARLREMIETRKWHFIYKDEWYGNMPENHREALALLDQIVILVSSREVVE